MWTNLWNNIHSDMKHSTLFIVRSHQNVLKFGYFTLYNLSRKLTFMYAHILVTRILTWKTLFVTKKLESKKYAPSADVLTPPPYLRAPDHRGTVDPGESVCPLSRMAKVGKDII